MCTLRFAPRTPIGTALLWLALLSVWASAAPVPGVEPPPQFKPGFNLFSAAQDVQVGKEKAAEVNKQVPLLRDAEVDRYVNELGRRLVNYAPNNRAEYVWQFKVINSSDINAFALPGGYIYVNRATMEAAEDEAQLAGALAHEEGHVVMRHGTHQATDLALARAPLSIIGSLLGDNDSFMSRLAELGIGVGVTSVFLHNSRAMEEQADQVGAYILYQAGYDPRAMAQFFEVIERKYPQRTIEFFSDHPNPENRVQKVEAEIPALGPAKDWKTNSVAFETAKRRLLATPPAPKPKPPAE